MINVIFVNLEKRLEREIQMCAYKACWQDGGECAKSDHPCLFLIKPSRLVLEGLIKPSRLVLE